MHDASPIMIIFSSGDISSWGFHQDCAQKQHGVCGAQQPQPRTTLRYPLRQSFIAESCELLGVQVFRSRKIC